MGVCFVSVAFFGLEKETKGRLITHFWGPNRMGHCSWIGASAQAEADEGRFIAAFQTLRRAQVWGSGGRGGGVVPTTAGVWPRLPLILPGMVAGNMGVSPKTKWGNPRKQKPNDTPKKGPWKNPTPAVVSKFQDSQALPTALNRPSAAGAGEAKQHQRPGPKTSILEVPISPHGSTAAIVVFVLLPYTLPQTPATVTETNAATWLSRHSRNGGHHIGGEICPPTTFQGVPD